MASIISLHHSGEAMLTLVLKSTSRASVSLPCTEGGTAICPISVEELEWLQLTVLGVRKPQHLRLLAGDMVVASKPDKLWAHDDAYAVRFPTSQYFERFAGLGNLRVVESEPPFRTLCQLEVPVHPSKITIEKLAVLIDDLEQLELGLILDVYGKTEVSLEGSRPVRSLPPEAFLRKAEQAVSQLQGALAEMNHRPYHSTREVCEMRPYRPGLILRPSEIGALTQLPGAFSLTEPSDPDAIEASGIPLRMDWVPRTEIVPDYDVYEHRALRGFLQYLGRALMSLAQAARMEYNDRNSTHARANSWWAEIDEPRLPLLLERERQAMALARECVNLQRAYPFLATAGRFVPPARITPAFRRIHAYRRAFSAMAPLWQATGGAEVRYAPPGHERAKAQDISRLYEYWGTLKVLQLIARHFDLVIGAEQSFVDTRRFVTTLRTGAEAWFRSQSGRVVRVRYEPLFRAKGDGALGVGKLGTGAPLRPDMTLEIFQTPTEQVPQTMIVLDFKYRRDGSAPLSEDLDKIGSYMQNIVDLRTWPKRLPRHGWIIYPSDASEPFTDYEIFDPNLPESQVETKGGIPVEPGGDHEVLTRTLLRLLELEGIRPTRPVER